MNKVLILDIGNSLIKISLANASQMLIEKTYLFGTAKFLFWKDAITQVLNELDYQEVIIGSVAPSINEQIIKLLPQDKKLILLKGDDFNFLEFARKVNLNEIGVDILGFALYLIMQKESSIGISFGTAIFAILIKNKKIMGVSISPSINRSFNEMHKKIEMIDPFSVNQSHPDFGLDSQTALEAGYYHLTNGLVNSILEYANKKYNINDVYIAGGNCKGFEKLQIPNNYQINLDEPQIVTMGYLYLYKKIFNKVI
ncbi:MAG: type III pantothenate kinase [Mycoplasmoidaceae bacterium]